jgi:NAD-dependent dihydropyrimidine dehydrogenase PreA subunit
LGEDIMRVEIEGRLVGLVGLRAAFEDPGLEGHEDPDSLKQALLERVEAVNYVPVGLREAYADAVYWAYVRHHEGGGGEDRKHSSMTWRGIARETIQWYPIVDDGACDGCKRCIDFCTFGVFAYERESETVRVESPFACVVGCSLCSTICKPRAITFPPLSYLDNLIKSRG